MQETPTNRPLVYRWLGVLLAVTGLLMGTNGRADVLTITVPSSQPVQLQLQGVANKDYAIQTTGDLTLSNWTTLASGASDASGAYQASDNPAEAMARFYRAALLPGIQTRTSTVATVANNAVTVVLTGSDPLQPGDALSAIITQLPAGGTLSQIDGTPITAIGTVVSDPQNRVQFVPAADAVNPPDGSYTSFGYELKRTSNGVTSLPQMVNVSLDPNWVYSSFDDATQKLQLAYSLDGIQWSQTGDLYTAPGGNGVRDSSIVKLNGTYYVAYTAGSFGAADYIQICSSPDLVHWTYLCNVDTTVAGYSSYSWAPEWFVDQDGTVYLYISRPSTGGMWRLFYTTALSSDLTTWLPLQMVGGDMVNRGAIDPQVVRDGSIYYLVYRNYGSYGNTECVELARGTSPTAFTFFQTGDWARWGAPREGPCLVHLGGSRWRIYFVLASGSNPATLNGSLIAYSESSDGMATWTAPIGTNVPQHGTCFALHAPSGTSAGDRAIPTTLPKPTAVHGELTK